MELLNGINAEIWANLVTIFAGALIAGSIRHRRRRRRRVVASRGPAAWRSSPSARAATSIEWIGSHPIPRLAPKDRPMARFMQYSPVGNQELPGPTLGPGPHYLDLDSIVAVDLSPKTGWGEGGVHAPDIPQVVVFLSSPGLPSATIQDKSQIDAIRAFLDGRSHC